MRLVNLFMKFLLQFGYTHTREQSIALCEVITSTQVRPIPRFQLNFVYTYKKAKIIHLIEVIVSTQVRPIKAIPSGFSKILFTHMRRRKKNPINPSDRIHPSPANQGNTPRFHSQFSISLNQSIFGISFALIDLFA